MEINTTIYINESELTEKITTKLCKEIKESVKESIEAYIPIAVEKFCSDSRNVEVAVKDAVISVLYHRYKTGFEEYNKIWNDQQLMDREAFNRGVSLALIGIEAMQGECPDIIKDRIYSALARSIESKIKTRYSKDRRDQLLRELIKSLEESDEAENDSK